jgi:hypothetical protein
VDHDSVLFCDEITTVDHEFLGERPLGPPVSGRILTQVVKAVRRAMGDVVPDSD